MNSLLFNLWAKILALIILALFIFALFKEFGKPKALGNGCMSPLFKSKITGIFSGSSEGNNENRSSFAKFKSPGVVLGGSDDRANDRRLKT